MADDESPKLVIPPCSEDDTIMVVLGPELRGWFDTVLLHQGWKLFPIPCEAGHEDDDLPSFAIERRHV